MHDPQPEPLPGPCRGPGRTQLRPRPPRRGSPRNQWSGNLLLDDLLGARIRWAAGEEPLAALEAAAEAERAAGHAPYVIPYGGSNAIGAAAYALAFQELWGQMAAQELHFDRVLFASSSGVTQAGLVDLIRRGEIGRGETVLFWHTGGTPALFAYAPDLMID